MSQVTLVCHLLDIMRQVSASSTVSLAGGEVSSRMEDSLEVVDEKMVLQVLGEREEGESLDRTRRNDLQDESRNSGTFLSSSSSSLRSPEVVASRLWLSTLHQLARAGLFSSQMEATTAWRSEDMLPAQV